MGKGGRVEGRPASGDRSSKRGGQRETEREKERSRQMGREAKKETGRWEVADPLKRERSDCAQVAFKCLQLRVYTSRSGQYRCFNANNVDKFTFFSFI